MIDSFDRLKLADSAPSGSEPPESVLTREALLVELDERAGYMPIDTQLPEAVPRDPKTTRRGWLTAAVAFGVVLLFGAVTILMMNQAGDAEPADEITSTTLTLSAEQQVAYDAAIGAITTFNSGDIEAWMKLFRQDGAFYGTQMSGSHTRDFVAFRMAINEQVVIDRCEPIADTLPASESVKCFVTTTEDLKGRAGFAYEGIWIVKSDERGRLLDINQTDADGRTGSDDPGEYIAAMGFWVQDTYPEVFAETFAAPIGCPPNSEFSDQLNCFPGEWYATPETAKILLELEDEFLAQSDEYPVTD